MAPRPRRRAERLVAAGEEARRRIARDLHDDHCQRLAALAIEVKAGRRGLVEGDRQKATMDAVGAGLAELGEDLRRLSHDLHPVLLERRGLVEALRSHCAEVERQHGVAVELRLGDDEGSFLPLPPELALGLYRVAQEALANVARHAGASTARVRLWAEGGTVRLTVTDDGTGFSTGEARQKGGLGLASIEERVNLLGGHLRLASAPGAGTEIEVAVPLPVAAGVLGQIAEVARRHRGLVASVALVLLALAAGLVTTLFQARRVRSEAAQADAAARFLERLFESADPRQARGEPPSGREILRHGSERLARELADQPALRARLLDTLGGIHTNLGLYDEARPLLQEALAIREGQRGPRSLEVAATLVRLGALAHHSGQEDAVPLFERALAIREARLGRTIPRSPKC